MTRFLDTRGKTTLGIGICSRCSLKFPLEELHADPNSPGLRVCKDDLDQIDPWRLGPRESDQITLEWPRPDVKLAPTTQTSPIPLKVPGFSSISTQSPVRVWTPSTAFALGTVVIPVLPTDTLTPSQQFLCIRAGLSGAVAPLWPDRSSIPIADNTIIWFSQGINLGVLP